MGAAPEQRSTALSLAIACGVAAGLALLAIARMPYGYYTFVRWSVCAVGVCAGVTLIRRGSTLGITLGLTALATAVLFNPIDPVHMSRASWRWFDGAAALILAAAAVTLGRPLWRTLR